MADQLDQPLRAGVDFLEARRGKDWPDVESLLATRGDLLDTVYIEDWLGQFAETLERPELLSEYHRIMRKTL